MELLESRLAPSGSGELLPEDSAEAPPAAVPCYVNDGAGEVGQYALGGWAAAGGAGGDYALTWSSDPRDGTGWDVYAPCSGAPGGPPAEAFFVSTATAGDPAHTAVPMAPGGSFALTWASDTRDGLGWDVYGTHSDR